MMANRDVHILDWSQFALEHNTQSDGCESQSTSNAVVSKGLLFEDLVEKLLEAMFPGERWRRTGKSHDGKRDFVFPFEDYLPEEKWAECKNYSSNLAINILAPTLIMGTLENIKTILVFSYSPLNDNAIDSIYRYATTESRKIKLFDGTLLESLICKYCHIPNIAKFFPSTDFSSASIQLSKKTSRLIYSVRYPSGTPVEQKHIYELGERFYIRALIQNTTMDMLRCKLTITPNKSSTLKSDYEKKTLILPAGEIDEYLIKCDCLSGGTGKCEIVVSAGSDRKSKNIVVKICDEPYLAWTGEKALDTRSACMAHLINAKDRTMIIAGSSGTGKSRLLEILVNDTDIQRKYQILKIDLKSPRNNCVQDLIFQGMNIHGNDVIPEDQVGGDLQILSTLISSYAENSDKLADTILKLYVPTRPFLIVIDDVQEINSSYILLLHALIYKSEEKNTPIYFCFALNEDIMSVDELVCQMNWDKNYQSRSFSLYHLKKYDKADIVLFLKTQYGLSGIDDLFDNYNREISPLELHSFCLRLRKAKIIAKNGVGQVYHITNYFKFADAVRNVLYSTIPFKQLCVQIDGGRLSTYVLKYICVVGYASDHIRSFCQRQIKSLVELGILKETNQRIIFYHDQIHHVVEQSLKFTEDDYAEIFADTGTDIFARAICVLSKFGRIRAGNDFLVEFWNMNHECISPNQRFEICKLIVNNLSAISKHHMVSSALTFLRKNLNGLSREQGHSKLMPFYKSLADAALIPCWDTDPQSVDNMAYLIKKYFDRALSTYQYQNCKDYYVRFEKLFRELTNISDKRRYYWLMHYANRFAIILDRNTVPLLPEPTEVAEQYMLATAYRVRAGSPTELILQDLVDGFNRHYIYRHDLTKATLTDIYLQLQRLDRTLLDRTIILDYHLVFLEYLIYHWDSNTKDDNYLELQEKVHQIHNDCTSAFYSLKLYILEMYISIELNDLVCASQQLSKALEYAYINDMRNSIYRLTYIQTQLYILQNQAYDQQRAHNSAIQALEQMIDARGNSISRMKQEQYLVDNIIEILGTYDISEIIDSLTFQKEDIRTYLHDTSIGLSHKDRLFHSYICLRGIDWPQI